MRILRLEALQTNAQSQVQVNDYKFLRLANWTRTTEIISSSYTQLQMFPWHTDSQVEKIASNMASAAHVYLAIIE